MSDFSLRMQDIQRQLHIRGSITYADGTSCAIDGGHILSASIDEGADGALTPGCVLSAGCTLDLDNGEGQWLPGGDMLHYQSLIGAQLRLELGVGPEDDVLWQDMGVFTILRALQLEQEGRLRIEAADGISTGMAAAFQDGLAYPATLETLWLHAAAQTGRAYSGAVPNGGAVIAAAPEWNGASLRAALGYIAAAAGCFVRIGRGGALELCRAWDDDAAYALDADGYMRLECGSAKFGPVDMLRVTPNGGEERKYSSDGTGVGLYSFAVSGNPLFCEGGNLDALAQGLLAQVAGYESVQADFEWRGDPGLCIGRRVLISDTAGRQVQGVLARQTLRFDGGFSAVCSCAVPDESQSGMRRILTADGGLNAGALVGSVDGGLLKVGSVTAEKIAAGVISAQAIQAVSAYIGELAAGNITTDQLYADLATIAAAQITAANIEKANIDWANIDTLNANIADISLAKIQTADIDYAKIKDLVTDTAIITEGVGGQLYIARLAVTEANMVQLTVGSLMLKAEDGSFVRLVADGSGVKTEKVEVEGENIAESTISGTNLIQNTITARELNVAKIFADQALIGAIKAANIDVANLFAAEATIEQLDSWVVSANTIKALQGALDLWASEKINIAVGEIDTSTAQNVQNSSVTITPQMVRILTSLFSVQNEATGMTLDENGLSAEHVSAPNLQEKYTGPSSVTVGTGGDYGSLAAFASEISGKYVPEDVTATLLSDVSGAATFRHVSGADVRIEGGGYSMYAPLNVENCTSRMSVVNLTLSYSGSVASLYTGSRVYLSGCIFNTSATARSGASITLDQGAQLLASNCQFYNTLGRLINVWELSRCVLEWCAGAVTTGPYAFALLTGSDLRSYGSYPAGTVYSDESSTYALNGTADSGTAQGTASSLTTQEFTCTNSDTCRGSSNWDGSGYIWQGYTTSGIHRGYMWFDGLAAAISGKTIKSATLKLRRVKGIGRSGATTLHAYYSLMTTNSGSATAQTGYGGEIGSIGNDETKVLDLPVEILTRMQSYGYGGICLYSAETSVLDGKGYSKNYCKLYGANSDYAPVLTVTYQ